MTRKEGSVGASEGSPLVPDDVQLGLRILEARVLARRLGRGWTPLHGLTAVVSVSRILAVTAAIKVAAVSLESAGWKWFGDNRGAMMPASLVPLPESVVLYAPQAERGLKVGRGREGLLFFLPGPKCFLICRPLKIEVETATGKVRITGDWEPIAAETAVEFLKRCVTASSSGLH